MLPKYRINDQVIVISKDTDISYSLGIIKAGKKNGGSWIYDVIIGKTVLTVSEDYIQGTIFERKDLNSELQKIEDAIIID